jgi:RimJ/RimL family protein N-acetyltransferase
VADGPPASAGTEELGEVLDWRPARRPERAPLSGLRVVLEPLDPDRHAAALYEASSGPAAHGLWDYLPVGPFADLEAFAAWVRAAADSDDPLFYAVCAGAEGRPQGVCSFLRITPDQGTIEIGHIWFAPALQRTAAATEAIYLLAAHAFDGLGYRRLEWKCNALNARSRRAAERFGFGFEGVFRQHMIVKGRNRDTAWYALLHGDWPPAREAFERWLDPDNFGPDGGQRRGLAAIRDQLGAAAAGA